jgi:hypothetical protein
LTFDLAATLLVVDSTLLRPSGGPSCHPSPGWWCSCGFEDLAEATFSSESVLVLTSLLGCCHRQNPVDESAGETIKGPLTVDPS